MLVVTTRRPPTLTRVELEVMRTLWARDGGATVHDVQDALARPLAYTTVLTVLRVLEQKGFVAHAPGPRGGRAHLYRPLVAEERVRRSHLRDLLDRFFGGRADALVTGLLDDEKWSRAELQALRAEIDRRIGRPRRS